MSRRLRIVVDFDLCESNAVCVGHAPDVFEVDDDDHVQVLVERPSNAQLEAVERAVRSCPKAALSLVDE